MSDLYHVIYAGQLGIDSEKLVSESSDLLRKMVGKKFKSSSMENVKTIFVDHPNDMEEVINTLDVHAIACSNILEESACVYVIASFILAGDNRKNSDILSVLKKVNSKI